MATAVSVLASFLLIIYTFLVLYLNKGWRAVNYYFAKKTTPKTYVSIIIAARNEAEKIHLTIDDILAQNYPKSLFELILVDDHSTDNTALIIESYASKGVKLIRLNESEKLNSYKKKAISEAINIANGALIITTDADCRMGTSWLSTIVNFYEHHDFKMISSPVAYFEEKSFFEQLQTLEFLYLIGLGAASIGNKMPSTCNGANLCYRKDTFLELDGFKGIDDLASGDDELLLHKVASKYPGQIGFLKNFNAIVYTHAKPNLSAFIQQRRRWASKSVKYKDLRIVALGISIWVFNISLVLNAVFSIFFPQVFFILMLQMMIKFLVELIYLYPIVKFAKRKALLFYLPILTIVHIFYFIYIGIAGNSGKYNWKGRMVK